VIELPLDPAPMNKEILLQKMSKFMNSYWKTFPSGPTVAELAGGLEPDRV
jgi:hypothetical protein